jgi:hypothetical protein
VVSLLFFIANYLFHALEKLLRVVAHMILISDFSFHMVEFVYIVCDLAELREFLYEFLTELLVQIAFVEFFGLVLPLLICLADVCALVLKVSGDDIELFKHVIVLLLQGHQLGPNALFEGFLLKNCLLHLFPLLQIGVDSLIEFYEIFLANAGYFVVHLLQVRDGERSVAYKLSAHLSL